MAYRGAGGYLPIFVAPRRRVRAGDLSDISLDDPGSYDESAGLDLSAAPDFSDVTGGSSADYEIGSAGFSGSSLARLGSSALSLFGGGGLGTVLGSAAAAGAASSAVGGVKGLRKKLGRWIGGSRSGRRMNPGNFKALRRSMRRLQAFERAARHVVKFTHPKPTARVKFKFRRRRRH